MVSWIVGAGLLVMLTSLVGVIFVGPQAERWLGTRLSYLVAFSAGVFMVTSGALVIEVFHLFENTLFLGAALIMVGYVAAWGVERLLPESHHHHDPHDHGHTHGRASARKVLVGDAIHNVGDGLMLVPAFLVSPALGVAVTASVLVHEALQELSEFFVLKQAGYSTKKALCANLAVSSTIFVGLALGVTVAATELLEGLLLALSAGFFLHVVVHDLLPRRHDHPTARQFLHHIGWLLVGLSLMALLAWALGDAHEHGDEPDVVIAPAVPAE